MYVGSKHTFSYLEQMDLKDKVLDKLPTSKSPPTTENNQNKDDKTHPTDVQRKEENKATATATPSSSSWASLFKASTSTNTADNTIKTTAEGNQSDKPSSILSIQNEQEKENETSKSDKQNLLTLITMVKDQRAIKLAGM